MSSAVVDEAPTLSREYLSPIYSQQDIARIVGAPQSTINRWTETGGAAATPLITTARPGQGLTVPFVGLTQAFVLWSFRRAGVPMQRIRPAVEALERELGLEYVLASNRLVTDGAEVLLRAEPGAEDDRLIVARSGQAVFNPVVDQYLRQIKFDDGYAASLDLPRFERTAVSVDPHVNGGRPTVRDHGVALADVISRMRAGEPAASVADDYGMAEEQVRSLLFQAA